MLNGLVESILMSLLPIAVLVNSDPQTGQFETFWEAGALCLTAIIIIVNLKMFFIQHRWYPVSIVVLFLSIASWFMIAYIISSFYSIDFDWFTVWYGCMGSPNFWLGLFLMVTVVIAKDVYVSGLDRNFSSKELHTWQNVRKYYIR